ncbi:MAG: AAA family ATPase [Gammaproteobacteria bacterium]|nr:AAA family ATPase [Gammaproteobacteria bacterium]NIR85188.1 AAA family ATPase [Gammaproteobacteria bacterium]NIU06237.1 AAA family ATPase [Gammaproteobacteria bacterium]NIX87510.1 AAA family ATPase [Gammaproteobacteria bacterium]
MKLDPSQKRAVELVCSAPVGVVTGGPGVGKTTCLRTALDELDRVGCSYLLGSPTGKAALRLQEATGRKASTIHRMLGFHPVEGWRHDAENPLDADLVVIDEASMIDVELGAALLDAIDARRTRLMLIGDADQLPPVGPGRLFGDLIDSGQVPVARLTTLHRAAQDSWVCRNAHRAIRGQMPELEPCDDFRFVEIQDAAAIVPALCKLASETIPLEINDEFQILIPQRPRVAGIEAANPALQQALNPPRGDERYIERGKAKLRAGDRVIHTRNNYTLGVFNGEVGDVVEVTTKGLTVQYADRAPVEYTLEQTGDLQLAYALTVHKSQGSEWPWVVVVCHSTHTYSLGRQLLYTAITRAKKGVIVVGNKKGIRAAIAEKEPPKRNTGLVERLRGEIG